MNKLIIAFFLTLGITNILWSQKVVLHIEIIEESTSEKKELKLNSFDQANQKLNTLVDSLKQTGYPFLTQQTLSENNTLSASIHLNQKIDSIFINVKEEHLNLLPNNLSLKQRRLSVPYSEINSILNYVILSLKESGSAFGKATLTNIEKQKNSLAADLQIERGQSRTIDKINIEGYSLLSKTYIYRYSNLKLGKTFKESEIQRKTEQLNNISFIKVKKPTEVLFKRDSTELFIYLEKINSNSFDGFLGFGNTEENGFQLNGYLNMVLLNNLNFGERLSIIYKNDGIDQQTFEGNISLPFILKSPLSLEAGLRLFRRDSLFSNSSQDLKLSYQLNEKLSLQGGVEFTNSTNIEPERINSGLSISDFNSTFYNIGLKFIKLNSRLGFYEDTFLDFNASFGKREAQVNSDQYKLSVEGQHQISLNYRNKIYFHLKSQFLISDDYFNNELFRFGGINSIRGFAENSLLANRFAILKTEYRYLLDDNLFVNSVLDVGNYKNSVNKINENILGYGIGLGLKSKAGVFRLILANSVSNSENSNFSNSKIHIGFISYF